MLCGVPEFFRATSTIQEGFRSLCHQDTTFPTSDPAVRRKAWRRILQGRNQTKQLAKPSQKVCIRLVIPEAPESDASKQSRPTKFSTLNHSSGHKDLTIETQGSNALNATHLDRCQLNLAVSCSRVLQWSHLPLERDIDSN